MSRTVDEYAQLITQFHVHRPKFNATIRSLTSAPVQAGITAEDLPRAFDLDEAIGVQLDVVGEWVGRTRFVPYPMDTFWFTLDDPSRGLDMSVWRGPYDAEWGTYRLDDQIYRRLLYVKIALNVWDGTNEAMKNDLRAFYGSDDISPGSLPFLDDKGDKSATFGIAGAHPPPIVLAMLAWPALPMDVGGVTMRTRVASLDSSPLFGFDVDNAYVSGLDKGSLGVPPQYIMETQFPGTEERKGVLDFTDPEQAVLIGSTA
jgi:hypothetical protein